MSDTDQPAIGDFQRALKIIADLARHHASIHTIKAVAVNAHEGRFDLVESAYRVWISEGEPAR